jgi:hypothetical protein
VLRRRLTTTARSDQDYCYPKAIGYKPAEIMASIDGGSFSVVGTHVADDLTNAFILHPIACGLAFIAALFALGGAIGSLVGTLVAVVAWIITLVVMVFDFVAFGVRWLMPKLSNAEVKLQIIKNHVNSDGSGSHAFYSVGMWTCLAAFILLFFGTIIVFFTCCTRRRRDRGLHRETKTSRRSRW